MAEKQKKIISVAHLNTQAEDIIQFNPSIAAKIS